MASLQVKTSRGHKYWQIVESKRINGKPRPIVLAHLGTAESILKKLQGDTFKVKSYSHGLVCSLLKLSKELDIVSIINKHTKAQRKYFSEKPIRNNLTVGASLLLAAIGRICLPTSKQGWFGWAKTTSLSYLLQMNFSKVDSQHFWDLMDSLPSRSIKDIELEILRKVKLKYGIRDDIFLYDTTNFYTYIATTNKRCTIAKRGKNKQKRTDLRQVGLAMAVSKEDNIPIFHETYQGNMNDSPVFRKIVVQLKQRIKELGLSIDKQTIVFDRGCNSKDNLKLVSDMKMFYVGALTPSYHKQLIADADNSYENIIIKGKEIPVYRDKKVIWGEERTVLVFISDKLKKGQIRGIYSDLEKITTKIEDENNRLKNPNCKKFTENELNQRVGKIINSKKAGTAITWEILKNQDDRYQIKYNIESEELTRIEDSVGFRIIISNRHNWKSADIINAYHGQSHIENSFRNIKNPFHLAVTPEFHWTDQKIQVHFFTCVLGFLLATIICKTVKEKTDYKGNLDNLLDMLSCIRMTSLIKQSGKKGKFKVNYQIEELDDDEKQVADALKLNNDEVKPIKMKGISVYK